MSDPDDCPVAGVRAIEHTADVGLEVAAADLGELVQRAALGLTWLLLERTPTGDPHVRELSVRADAPPALLRETLRELLWWHERDGLSLEALSDIRVEEDEGGFELRAAARLAMDQAAPVREIKGVTLHGLVAEARGTRWYGQVIFDV